MELIEVLQGITASAGRSAQGTDLCVGTVEKDDPLEIKIDGTMATIRRPLLYLTEPVIEKKIPVLTHKHYISTLGHTHVCPTGTTGTGLPGKYLGEDSLVSEGHNPVLQGEDIVCWEHGKKLPIEKGYIILNRRLKQGDKVLMLRVQNGQRFVVLSRVFEEEG